MYVLLVCLDKNFKVILSCLSFLLLVVNNFHVGVDRAWCMQGIVYFHFLLFYHVYSVPADGVRI